MEKRYFKGVRGISCFLIFTHHFIIKFFPSTALGAAAPSFLSGQLDTYISSSIFGVFNNGQFLVSVFLVLSGFAISLKIFNGSEEILAQLFVKRYLRLALPMLCVSLLIYFFILLGGNYFAVLCQTYLDSSFSAPIALEMNLMSLLKIVGDSFSSFIFGNAGGPLGIFWMITPLFFGTALSLVTSSIAKAMKKTFIPYFYFFMILAFSVIGSIYLNFIMGSLIAYIVYKYKYKRFDYKMVSIACLLLLATVYLGGYPSYAPATGVYSGFSNVLGTLSIPAVTIYAIGSLFLFFSLFIFENNNFCVKGRYLLFLDKLSFSVYLVHGFINASVGLFSFYLLMRVTDSYIFSCFVSYIISSISLLLIAVIFNEYIEKNCNKVSGKIINFMFEKNKKL